MSEAYGLLIEPFASFGFMRTALVACVALALANGPIGTLLLLRRMSLEGDVLSHAVMPGAALGFLYAGYSFAALSFGGFVTGALVAGSAGFSARLHPKRREASLAAFYLLSLAVGVMIVSVRGSNVDLMHVLFGTVLAVDMRGLLFIATVSSVTLLVLAVIYRPLAVELVRSDLPAFGRRRQRRLPRHLSRRRGAQPGREFSSIWNAAGDRADVAPRCSGPVLDREDMADHRAQCRDRNGRRLRRIAHFLLCQSAVRTGHRVCVRHHIRHFPDRCRPNAAQREHSYRGG